MAIKSSPNTERSDGSKKIVGDSGVAVAQDANNRLQSAIYGDSGNVIAQDSTTGEMLAKMIGAQDIAVAQDSSTGQMLARLVGNQNTEVSQESSSGKLVLRQGGAEGDTDVNVGTKSSPRDLIGDGDYASGTRNTGGAEAIAGEFETDDSNSFDVKIDWIDANDNVVKTHAPSATQGITSSVEFAFRIRSDRWKLRVEDSSGAGQNRVHGSANTH